MIEERLLVAGGITLAIGEFDAYTASNEGDHDYDDDEVNRLWSRHYGAAQEEMVHEVVSAAYDSTHGEEFNRHVIEIAHHYGMEMVKAFEEDLEEL